MRQSLCVVTFETNRNTKFVSSVFLLVWAQSPSSSHLTIHSIESWLLKTKQKNRGDSSSAGAFVHPQWERERHVFVAHVHTHAVTEMCLITPGTFALFCGQSFPAARCPKQTKVCACVRIEKERRQREGDGRDGGNLSLWLHVGNKRVSYRPEWQR